MDVPHVPVTIEGVENSSNTQIPFSVPVSATSEHNSVEAEESSAPTNVISFALPSDVEALPIDLDTQPETEDLIIPTRAKTQAAGEALPDATELDAIGDMVTTPIDTSAESDDQPLDQRPHTARPVPIAPQEQAFDEDLATSEFALESASPIDPVTFDAIGDQPDATTLNFAKPQIDTPVQTQSIAQPAPARPPERIFSAENVPSIVTNVRANLLPNGGTMQITLNPPELGTIQVSVRMTDGVMNASFATTSEHATRLLSHSLSDLRTTLENSGVAVDKLHVEQSPKNQQSQNQSSEDRQQQNQSQDSSARRDQERRELLQRMWRKLTEGSDPLDLVA
jgi:flagellar hook-length control protein FliK